MSTKRERKENRRNQKRNRQQQNAQTNMPDPAPPAEPINAADEVAHRQDVTEGPNNEDRHEGWCSRCPWWITWLSNPGRRAMLLADLLFSGVIAAATCAQVYYGNKQWDATEKQWKAMLTSNEVATIAANAAKESKEIAADTAQKQLRAYITVTGAKTIHYDKATGLVSTEVKVKNVGLTPAFDVYAYVQFWNHPDDKDRTEMFEDVGTISPGSDATVQVFGFVEPKNRTGEPYVDLRITHIDIFARTKKRRLYTVDEFGFLTGDAIPNEPNTFKLEPGRAGSSYQTHEEPWK